MNRRCLPWLARLLPFLLAVFLASAPADGHELNSASLSLTEVEGHEGRFLVGWQASSSTLQSELATPAVFPPPCKLDGAFLDCGQAGLVGAIELPWLEGTETNVMVVIEWRSGSRLFRVLTGSDPSVVVYGIPSSAGLRALKPIVVDYTWLGVEHILTGFDHLLFVVALTLLVRGGRKLVGAVTAFTVAHSLTLACAVFGWLTLPAPPVEAAIALSIVLVCGECIRPNDSLARRAPWAVTFAFGLLHGLGFASSLLDIGLPERHVPTALLFFNVGVEIGQLGVIALVVALSLFAARIPVQPATVRRGLVYAMGGMAGYWSIERIVATLTGPSL
ncbi:HupE/UreJ family protein [Sorangium sp. So ce1078]|uniref:HupE/UreJ family protein n=1 Tax=Sorangium sp. So ce1078 TaxID=3133329 RepID=UPI003F642109